MGRTQSPDERLWARLFKDLKAENGPDFQDWLKDAFERAGYEEELRRAREAEERQMLRGRLDRRRLHDEFFDPEPYNDCLEIAQRLRPLYRRADRGRVRDHSASDRVADGGRSQGLNVDHLLSTEELARVDILSAALAKIAAAQDGVRDFRERYLGEPLTPAQVPAWEAAVALTDPGAPKELDDLAAWLAKRYPWRERGARWFVLTDAPPRVAPVACRLTEAAHLHYRRGTITLVVEPWLRAETVEKAYRRAQRKLLGRNNRPIEEKALALFAFVAERIPAFGAKVKWAALGREWNEAHREKHPEWCFDDEYKFHRAFENAAARLLYPWFDLSEDDGSSRPSSPAPLP